MALPNRPAPNLTAMPAELRNITYDALINTWVANHRHAQAQRWEIVPTNQVVRPGVFVPHNTIIGAQRPLVMTPDDRDPTGSIAYQTAMHDLIAPSRINKTWKMELRSRQRNQLRPFIHMDCLDEFMKTFYPLEDEATGTAITGYVGQPITLVLPWVHPRTFDVLPILKFLNDSPLMNVNTWAYDYRYHFWGAGVLSHRRQIATSIFGTLRNYMGTPNANSFDRIMFRSHNPRPDHNHASLQIWFRQPTATEIGNGVDDLSWVDGNDWEWPYVTPPAQFAPAVLPVMPRRAPGRAGNNDQKRKQSILDFLQATGLLVPEIGATWSVYFGIAGKHQRLSKGLRRRRGP